MRLKIFDLGACMSSESRFKFQISVAYTLLSARSFNSYRKENRSKREKNQRRYVHLFGRTRMINIARANGKSLIKQCERAYARCARSES